MNKIRIQELRIARRIANALHQDLENIHDSVAAIASAMELSYRTCKALPRAAEITKLADAAADLGEALAQANDAASELPLASHAKACGKWARRCRG